MCRRFEKVDRGARLRGLDPAGIAEVVSVSKFGSDAINLVFRVDGKVAERLVYRGEETSFEFVSAGRAYAFDEMVGSCASRQKPIGYGSLTCSTLTLP